MKGAKTFSEFKAEYQIFTNTIAKFKKACKEVNFKSAGSSAAGVAAGVGVATLGPTAAMAIATTFGTASTGTAIASLSGAAATNATLALLGGGALSVGGGGMVAGSRILALFGPVGIGISAVTLIGGGFYASWKNEEIAKEADKEREPVEKKSAELEIPIVEIHRLIDLTDEHQNGVSEILLTLKSNAPNDYQDYSSTQKNFLASLINHVQSLSKLLNKKVQ